MEPTCCAFSVGTAAKSCVQSVALGRVQQLFNSKRCHMNSEKHTNNRKSSAKQLVLHPNTIQTGHRNECLDRTPKAFSARSFLARKSLRKLLSLNFPICKTVFSYLYLNCKALKAFSNYFYIH